MKNNSVEEINVKNITKNVGLKSHLHFLKVL